jgi:hypothetical protein
MSENFCFRSHHPRASGSCTTAAIELGYDTLGILKIDDDPKVEIVVAEFMNGEI